MENKKETNLPKSPEPRVLINGLERIESDGTLKEYYDKNFKSDNDNIDFENLTADQKIHIYDTAGYACFKAGNAIRKLSKAIDLCILNYKYKLRK